MELPEAVAEPPADRPLERPGVLLLRGGLRGLRGALPTDLRREAAELTALAGPVVSAASRLRPPDGRWEPQSRGMDATSGFSQRPPARSHLAARSTGWEGWCKLRFPFYSLGSSLHS